MVTIPNITYNSILDIDTSRVKYKIVITQNDYKPVTLNLNTGTLEISSDEANGTSVGVYVKLDPYLEEKQIGKFLGKSLSNNCSAPIGIEVSWLARKQDLEKKLWDQPTVQNVADNLATSICSLWKSDPAISNIPIPKIKILQYMDIKYAAAYVHQGASVIFIDNKQLCGNLDNIATEKCRANASWLFSLPVHEYGHILDLIGSSPYDVLGKFSGQDNFKNLYKLVNASDVEDGYKISLFADCPKTATAKDPYNGNIRCYYTANEKEFWAESFAYWMGNSLASDLKLDPVEIKANTIPFNSSKFTTEATNTFNFWKKFMSTTLGAYCHPSLIDENGAKQGLSTYPLVEPKPSFTKGGPLAPGVVYTPDQILAGTPVAGSSLTINYKKLPANYVASTMTDENFSIVPYSTGINQLNLLTKFPATKGAWPDTLTKDANRCGIYERGMLAQSDKTADIKAADVKRGPYPLYSMKDYELRGYYRCNKTEAFKEVTVKGKTDLNTSTKDVFLDIDLTKYITCPKATTPTAPGMPR